MVCTPNTAWDKERATGARALDDARKAQVAARERLDAVQEAIMAIAPAQVPKEAGNRRKAV